MKALLTIAAALALTACGGGGSDAPEQEAPAAICVSRTVEIQVSGDSTNFGASVDQAGAVFRVGQNPEFVIQQAMDQRFGIGAVKVTTNAVPGSQAANLLEIPGWQGTADIVLVNYGINEWLQRTSVETYKANLRKLAATATVVFETPMPALGSPNYAQAMREVAAETGTPVIDVAAATASLPDWGAYLVDGIHPNSDGYGVINRKAVVPALIPMVAALRCE